MARTNSSKVEGVLLADYGPLPSGAEPSLTGFIEAASAFIDDVVVCVAEKELTPLSSARLELLERWVAAHLYCQSDKAFMSKSTGGASASYQGQTGMYFESTLYGQTAMRLDPSGCLQAAGGKEIQVASGFWLGRPPSAQTDYRDRN